MLSQGNGLSRIHSNISGIYSFSLSQEEEYCRNTHYRKCEDVPPQKQDSDQQHEKKAALNDQVRESHFNQPESDSVSHKHVSFTYAGRA